MRTVLNNKININAVLNTVLNNKINIMRTVLNNKINIMRTVLNNKIKTCTMFNKINTTRAWVQC